MRIWDLKTHFFQNFKRWKLKKHCTQELYDLYNIYWKQTKSYAWRRWNILKVVAGLQQVAITSIWRYQISKFYINFRVWGIALETFFVPLFFIYLLHCLSISFFSIYLFHFLSLYKLLIIFLHLLNTHLPPCTF